jgi:Ser/Thr protein kinase RdoA (MazF antagonist)
MARRCYEPGLVHCGGRCCEQRAERAARWSAAPAVVSVARLWCRARSRGSAGPRFELQIRIEGYAIGRMTEETLRAAVVAAYDLGEIQTVMRIDREASTVGRVESSERVYWLKLLTRSQRALGELESEATIACELAAQGIPVAPPVTRRDGNYAGTLPVGGRETAALLFCEAPGEELDALPTTQAEALGQLLGRFHAAVVPAADRRWRIDADALGRIPFRQIDAWLDAHEGATAREVARRCSDLSVLAEEMIAIAAFDQLPVGLCHGDITLENVRFAGARPTVFDLECCGTGPRAYDLACYWRKRIGLVPAIEAPPIAEWDALLRGYEQVRRLTAAERRAIPALATLRAIWVMALPATPGSTWGQDWLLDPEYVTAHAEMIERLARAAS